MIAESQSNIRQGRSFGESAKALVKVLKLQSGRSFILSLLIILSFLVLIILYADSDFFKLNQVTFIDSYIFITVVMLINMLGNRIAMYTRNF